MARKPCHVSEFAMDIDFGPSTLSLPRDSLVAIRHALGIGVICLRGSLWITQEGRGEDIVLGAGESFRISDRSLILVMALRPSELRVIEPHASEGEPLDRLLQRFALRTPATPSAA
jgi:Protein of unknown function (DUF2917)